jgi:hypothetical protein
MFRLSYNALILVLLMNFNLNAMTNMDQDLSKLYVKESAIWPKSADGSTDLTVCWDGQYENAFNYRHEKSWTEQAIQDTWGKYAKINFHWIGSCWEYLEIPEGVYFIVPPTRNRFANIRISINDEVPHTKGMGIILNNKPSGMVLNFTFERFSPTCISSKEFCIKTIAVHEFGHALGFSHEQNRPDTPATCKDQPQGEDGSIMIGEWDENSVMNYCNPKWSNHGYLSTTDIHAVRYFYGAK